MEELLEDMNMKDLRAIGADLGVKAANKALLIEKIKEARKQKEVKETIDAEEVLSEETKVEEVVEEINETAEESDTLGTPEGWDDVPEILGHDKWVDTVGVKMIKQGHSLMNIARRYCKDLGLSMSNKGSRQFKKSSGMVFKEKRYDDFFILIQKACK